MLRVVLDLLLSTTTYSVNFDGDKYATLIACWIFVAVLASRFALLPIRAELLRDVACKAGVSIRNCYGRCLRLLPTLCPCGVACLASLRRQQPHLPAKSPSLQLHTSAIPRGYAAISPAILQFSRPFRLPALAGLTISSARFWQMSKLRDLLSQAAAASIPCPSSCPFQSNTNQCASCNAAAMVSSVSLMI